jgi:hypothetical protein
MSPSNHPSWQFRSRNPDEIAIANVLRDAFSANATDVDSAIRESLQNVLDAARANLTPLVRINVRNVRKRALDPFLNGLIPHVAAAEKIKPEDIIENEIRCLVIEDFGTTGLLGHPGLNGTGSYGRFFGRYGESVKNGNANGSHGVGKAAFAAASELRAFFALTVREEDAPTAHLMGHAALAREHDVSGKSYVPYGYFTPSPPGTEQRSCDDAGIIARFSAATGLVRRNEPGLSIVIPAISDEIRSDELAKIISSHFFLPILEGKLVVEANGVRIDADAVASMPEWLPEDARKLAELELDRNLAVRIVPRAEDANPFDPASYDADELERAKTAFENEKAVLLSAPVKTQTRRDARDPNPVIETGTLQILVRRKEDDGQKRPPIHYRRDDNVLSEATCPRRIPMIAIVSSASDPLSALLRACENASHTNWDSGKQDVRKRHPKAAETIAFVKSAPAKLHALFKASSGTIVKNAFSDLFPKTLSSSKTIAASDRSEPKTVTQKTNRKRVISSPDEIRAAIGLERGTLSDVVIFSRPEFSFEPIELVLEVGYRDANGKSSAGTKDRSITGLEAIRDSDGPEPVIDDENSIRIIGFMPGEKILISGFDGKRDPSILIRTGNEK